MQKRILINGMINWDSALHSLNQAKQLLQILENEGLTSYGIETKKSET